MEWTFNKIQFRNRRKNVILRNQTIQSETMKTKGKEVREYRSYELLKAKRVLYLDNFLYKRNSSFNAGNDITTRSTWDMFNCSSALGVAFHSIIIIIILPEAIRWWFCVKAQTYDHIIIVNVMHPENAHYMNVWIDQLQFNELINITTIGCRCRCWWLIKYIGLYAFVSFFARAHIQIDIQNSLNCFGVVFFFFLVNLSNKLVPWRLCNLVFFFLRNQKCTHWFHKKKNQHCIYKTGTKKTIWAINEVNQKYCTVNRSIKTT